MSEFWWGFVVGVLVVIGGLWGALIFTVGFACMEEVLR